MGPLPGELLSLKKFSRILQNRPVRNSDESQMGEVRATFSHPRAWATDAFCLSWNQFRSIDLFPPPNVLPRVIAKLKKYKGHGVI